MTEHAAALLLLADGRLPAGGYAHSGGLEAAVRAGRLRTAEELEAFLTGRASTSGFVAAAFAAATCAAAVAGDQRRLAELDPELDARTPSPALRAVSRSLGRQLLRAVTAIQPHPVLGRLGRTPHQPVVLGAAAAAFELSPRDAALAVLHEAVAGPAAAAVKLLGLDPFHAHAVLASLTPLLDERATAAAATAGDPPADLPAAGAPLLDLAAEDHAAREVRLFAS